MADIHNSKKRMPLVLTPANEKLWLQGNDIEEFTNPEIKLVAIAILFWAFAIYFFYTKKPMQKIMLLGFRFNLFYLISPHWSLCVDRSLGKQRKFSQRCQ